MKKKGYVKKKEYKRGRKEKESLEFRKIKKKAN